MKEIKINIPYVMVGSFKVESMSKVSISCQNVGASDCDFEVRSASSEEELFEILTVHAKRGHGMQEIPADKVEAVKKAVTVH